MFKSPYFARLEKNLNRAMVVFKKKHSEVCSNCYPQEMAKIFERYIEVYGNSYCMDVPCERRKIAKLLYDLLTELSQPTATD